MHIEYTSDSKAQLDDAFGSGLHTHSVPPEQIGFIEVQPACGIDSVTVQTEHVPSALHIFPAPQVPDSLLSPCSPLMLHWNIVQKFAMKSFETEISNYACK